MINGIKHLRQVKKKKTPKVVSFLSIADDMLQVKSVRAKAVEWFFWNPNCFEYKILCRSKIFTRLLYITLSKSLEKAGRIDIGP